MTNSKINIAIVGIGKIVQDQHLPSITKSGRYELVATASRNNTIDGIKSYQSIDTLLQSEPQIDAVSLCMPPQYRFSAARYALNQGVDVLLEKPPGATVCEVEQLARLAQKNGCCLYTTWHSRHGAAVKQAKSLLAEMAADIASIEIRWKENVKKWHPGQEWIWQAGGLGVFDPGINGLSILTHILPEAFYVNKASLLFPVNKAAPIAADIEFKTESGLPITGVFDWRVTGDEEWAIEVVGKHKRLTLTHGGAQLMVDDNVVAVPDASEHGEYEAIYDIFANVITSRQSQIDLEPLKLVADAFLLGDRQETVAFEY